MIDRICISINSSCNLTCAYCHFREKNDRVPEEETQGEGKVLEILDHVISYAVPSLKKFKIGFVGDGEPFLDFPLLKSYISYLSDYPQIECYTITNGTIPLQEEDYLFLKKHAVTVGVSLDGPAFLHDAMRCPSFAMIRKELERYVAVFGAYPSFNATVGKETLQHEEEVISFFQPFQSKITFSRMIGQHGISMEEYETFLKHAEKKLSVRRGGRDCSMYGGRCSAGENNFYFAQGKVYLCGNCVDLPPLGDSGIPFEDLESMALPKGKYFCYKENLS